MVRLTSKKNVSDMGMAELAYNSCYIKDGNARYRDFGADIDARELARKLLKEYAEGEDSFTCDEDFDERMGDYLQDGMDSIEGLIAVFYRNLWAMAGLREKLQEYEDLEEQRETLDLNCAIEEEGSCGRESQGADREGKVSYSLDGETYGYAYGSVDEALEDAAAELKAWIPDFHQDGMKVYVGDCEFFRPWLFAVDTIESVICQADDEGFAEWSDDYLSDVTKEQSQELEERLNAVFLEWIEKHGLHANFYKVSSFREYLYDKAEGEFVEPEIYYSRRMKGDDGA